MFSHTTISKLSIKPEAQIVVANGYGRLAFDTSWRSMRV
jgi:hypothetical protein